MNCKQIVFPVLMFFCGPLFSFAQQLVLPGDHPDPSVVKIGDTYWASATSSNWMPAFPLLSSSDLVHWKQQGAVFTKKPDWADYYFWAPEISYDKGRVWIYYAAHKKKGNLCVGVASAEKPEGPYTDHGPLICQEVGSIDAFPMRDEKGQLWLIWKEDGNSVKKPTPIWASRINEERTSLTGEKIELFRNDKSWERNLVEGVSMIRQGEYFYAFYAAAGCCGPGCTYVTGVARSKSLLGPWEKDPRNPLLVNSGSWVCPGHGTPVEKAGRFYFLYHAYEKESHAFTGRQGLLKEFRFTSDNWIEFVNDSLVEQVKAPIVVRDDFKSSKLSDDWQWSVFGEPLIKTGKKQLVVSIPRNSNGLTYVGRKTFTGEYEALVSVNLQSTGAAAGIGAIGDEANLVSVMVEKDSLRVQQVRKGNETTVMVQKISKHKTIRLKMQVSKGKEIRFSYSTDGKNYLLLNEVPINGSFLPPWDRAVRVGLVARGSSGSKAVFQKFSLISF